jgi:hypothetical protein
LFLTVFFWLHESIRDKRPEETAHQSINNKLRNQERPEINALHPQQFEYNKKKKLKQNKKDKPQKQPKPDEFTRQAIYTLVFFFGRQKACPNRFTGEICGRKRN